MTLLALASGLIRHQIPKEKVTYDRASARGADSWMA